MLTRCVNLLRTVIRLIKPQEPHWKDVNNAEINHAKARRKDTDKKSDKAAWVCILCCP